MNRFQSFLVCIAFPSTFSVCTAFAQDVPPAADAPPAPHTPEPEDPAEPESALDIGGYVHAQFVWNTGSGEGIDSRGRPENLDLFEVRRGRVKLMYAKDFAELMMQIDAIPSGVRLIEAEASAIVPWTAEIETKLTLGQFRIPFGYELLVSDSELPFPERSTWTGQLFPGVRDLGFRVMGDLFDEVFVCQLAIVNGQPIQDSLFPSIDPNGSKDFVGRLGVVVGPFRGGVSGLVGRGYLPPEEDDEETEDIDETHDAIEFDRWAVGADAVLTVPIPIIGELALYAEAAYARDLNRRSASDYPEIRFAGGMPAVATGEIDDAEQFGWYVGFLQHLTDYAAVGTRIEQFDRDTDEDDDTITALNLVAHAYPTSPLRLTVSYQLNFEEGDSVANNQGWLRASGEVLKNAHDATVSTKC